MVTRITGQSSPVGLSILVPIYNEAKTVRSVLERLRRVPFPVPIEIIAVNDGSSDGTRDVLDGLPAWPDMRVVHHEVNGGKGAAIQTALSYARGRYVVVQDADNELEPGDILPLLHAVMSGEADVCYGSRFSAAGWRWATHLTFWANKVLNVVCNMLNGLRLTDMNTCYKLMPLDLARRIRIVSNGFTMEPEITTKLARLGATFTERPITYKPRSYAEGKKIRAWDFAKYLVAMVRFRLERMPTMMPAAEAVRLGRPLVASVPATAPVAVSSAVVGARRAAGTGASGEAADDLVHAAKSAE
jgi:glycosyltransferase involved in cell wall biosynthesis